MTPLRLTAAAGKRPSGPGLDRPTPGGSAALAMRGEGSFAALQAVSS
jgi:hypothetical protein